MNGSVDWLSNTYNWGLANTICLFISNNEIVSLSLVRHCWLFALKVYTWKWLLYLRSGMLKCKIFISFLSLLKRDAWNNYWVFQLSSDYSVWSIWIRILMFEQSYKATIFHTKTGPLKQKVPDRMYTYKQMLFKRDSLTWVLKCDWLVCHFAT